jgi:hypothetical protein
MIIKQDSKSEGRSTIDVVTRKELKNPAAKALLGMVQGEFGERITID